MVRKTDPVLAPTPAKKFSPQRLRTLAQNGGAGNEEFDVSLELGVFLGCAACYDDPPAGGRRWFGSRVS